MDKYEYNLKLEEINKLIENENFEDAAKIADTIDWRRVRNARTLCMISEVYEANDRLEDSKAILTRVYRRSQLGRVVLYRLTEVSIKMKDFDEAVEYYSEFVNAAPNDNSRYILKYKIYQGRGSSLEEQIEILEEFKQKEYTEKWAYELAMLYQQTGQIDKCIGECDDLVLWFRQGKYVIKALELKQRIGTLTPVQQAIYDHRDEQVPTKAEMVEATVPEIEKVIMDTMPNSEEEALTDNIITEAEKELAQAVTQHTAEIQNEPDSHADWGAPGEAEEDFLDSGDDSDQAEGLGDTVHVPSFDTKELQAELANSMREIVSGMTARDSDEGIIEPMNDKPFVDPNSQDETAEAEANPEDEVLPGQLTIDDILTSMATGEPVGEEAVPEAPAPIDPISEAPASEPLPVEVPEAAAPREEPSTPEPVPVKPRQITMDLSAAVEAAAGVTDMRPKEPQPKAEPEPVKAAQKEAAPEEIPQLTTDEQYIFSYFSSVAGLRENIAVALRDTHEKVQIDKTSKAGNIVITGNAGSGRTTLAICFAKVLSKKKGESSARIARVYAEDFNKKDIPSTVAKIAGGTLIIEEAADLTDEIVNQLSMAMEFRTDGLVVILEDEKHLLRELFERNPQFAEKFTTEVNVPIFTNDELVSFGRTYAYDEDYKIDNMATLALYNKIGEMQTPEHPVNVSDVKEIVDKAIKRSERFGLRKLGMIISRKRYDEDDRIILYEKDFK